MAYQIFAEKVERVELITGYEGNVFGYTGDVQGDLLSIVSVHPMRAATVFGDKKFYVRKFR